jgi:methylated-DNA-[protein]-cysteine S-methyltransferase
MGPEGVASIHFGREPSEAELRRLVRVFGPGIVPDGKRTSQVRRELDQYFEGKRRTFEVPFDLRGITPFQERVLRTTSKIGYGDVMTYAAVARSSGNEKASRAAGGAVGSNPIPIVVPCHRVVASDGTLGGYGGGLEAKRYLLAIERGGGVPPGGWPKHRS